MANGRVVLAWWLALASCGAENNDGRSDAAGAGGTPGSDAGVESSADAVRAGDGDDGTPSFPPTCLQDLAGPCPMQGPCTYETTSGGRWARACFAGGVRAEYEYSNPTVMCTPGELTTERVFRADRSLCYTDVTQMGPGCESSTITWSDGAGHPIATGGGSFNGPPLTVECENGETNTCSRPCEAILRPTCEPGACPAL